MTIRFLGLDEVLALHADQVARYGGMAGIRDLALLESAVAVPEASFGDDYLHATLPEMAAAYPFTSRTTTLPSTATSAWRPQRCSCSCTSTTSC